MNKLRKESGSMNVHLGDGTVKDLCLLFFCLPAFFLYVLKRTCIIYIVKNKKFAFKEQVPAQRVEELN
jgi:hypothetical protein